MLRFVAAGAALIVVPALLGAQATLKGVVRDSVGQPLREVEVLFEASGLATRSDSLGRYLLRVRAGTHAVSFRLLGFRPVRDTVILADGDTATLDVALAPGSPQQLAEVQVKERSAMDRRRALFEERRSRGIGQFIDSTTLRKSEVRSLGDVLRQLRGLRVIYAPDGRKMWAVHPTKMGEGLSWCYLSVVLDGMTMYRSGSRMDVPDLRHEFPLTGLEGIEVYTRAGEVPLEYQGQGNECGVLVLWTRRD